MRGEALDLRSAPRGISFIQLDGSNADRRKIAIAAQFAGKGVCDGVLVIGDSKNPASRHQLSRVVPGAIVVEPVDLGDMVDFLHSLNLTKSDALERVLSFAEEMMTGVGVPDLKRRLDSITSGKAKREPNAVETAALTFTAAPTPKNAAVLLSSISADSGVETKRRGTLKGTIRALQVAALTTGLSLHDAAIRVREQNRFLERALPKRAIGSTLLLKGLEADGVVILNAHTLNARNLYVAMTRGTRHMTILSNSHVLKPAR